MKTQFCKRTVCALAGAVALSAPVVGLAAMRRLHPPSPALP